LARPITDTGAALVEVDHVAKNGGTRGRFAIGGQQKLAGVAVAYGVEVIDRPSRQHTGRVKLLLAKDRHGHIPGQVGATVAIATIAPEDDGARVTVTLDPPDSTGAGETFRPTVIMERVSLAVEEHPGLTKRAIRAAVRGKAAWVDTALELLIAEGFIRAEAHGQARHHHVERPFRADEDDDRVPVSRPCPGHGWRRPCPHVPPYRGHGHGPHHHERAPTSQHPDRRPRP